MPLIRQVWLLLGGVLLLAGAGAVVSHTWMARESLATQLRVRNDDGAMLLALTLSQFGGDAALMQTAAAAHFDTGHYRRVRLVRSDGAVLFDREWPVTPGSAPAWFAGWLPVDAEPGLAQVSDGWRPVGHLEVSSQAAWAGDELWRGCLRMAGALAVIALLAAAVAAWVVGGWRRALKSTVDQAHALQALRFVQVDEPAVPEFRQLTRSMNAMARRLQGVFDDQAAQLEQLGRQAQADAATGLPARRAFVARLHQRQQAEGGPGAGLLILRVLRLQAMNQRIGHDATDRLLAAVAQVLQSYPRRVPGAVAGRLNGSDFALLLPARGTAAETASVLAEALRAALARVDPQADMRLGGVEVPPGGSASAALATADEALARAEAAGPFGVVLAPSVDHAVGEGLWQARISAALESGRSQLAEHAVRHASGELLHLECPLRLQFDPQGGWQPASVWLAMAGRCGLTPQVDLTALELALAAIGRDGRPRAVHVAAASLRTAGFVAAYAQRLRDAPAEAAQLSVDVAEAAAKRDAAHLREACAAWRPAGARVGLEHGGLALRSLAGLGELGLDYVKLDATVLREAARDPAVAELARGLVGLLRQLRLQVLAEGVVDAADRDALWALGFHGASGPAVPG